MSALVQPALPFQSAQPALEDIARRAGAILRCGVCRSGWISALCEETESTALAMTATAWKGGEFRAAPLVDVQAAMRSVLRDANDHRSSCKSGSD